ncbi:MAG: hypothetical protein ACKVVT_10755 [Dehalococcoidia bacterium]
MINAARGGCEPVQLTAYAPYANLPVPLDLTATWSGPAQGVFSYTESAASGTAFSNLNAPLPPGVYTLTWSGAGVGRLGSGTVTLSCS